MERLMHDLKDKLALRKEIEFDKIRELDKTEDRDLILIYSGKILELDFLINSINEMLAYFDQTKKIVK